MTAESRLSVSQGSTSLDGGTIATDGGGNLTASGRISGELNTTATVSSGSTPTGGSSGDMVLDTTNGKLWINFAGTWKAATLT